MRLAPEPEQVEELIMTHRTLILVFREQNPPLFHRIGSDFLDSK